MQLPLRPDLLEVLRATRDPEHEDAGRRLVASGQVHLQQWSGEVKAEVQTEPKALVQLHRDEDGHLVLACSCEQLDPPCAHLWAVALSIGEAQPLSTSVDREAQDERFAVLQQNLSRWRSSERRPNAMESTGELAFEIDLHSCRMHRAWVIQFLRKRLRRTRQGDQLETSPVDSLQPSSEWGEDDLAIIHEILPAEAASGRTPRAPGRLTIDSSAAKRVLRRIALTGRASALGDEIGAKIPVRWFGDEPFTLEITMDERVDRSIEMTLSLVHPTGSQWSRDELEFFEGGLLLHRDGQLATLAPARALDLLHAWPEGGPLCAHATEAARFASDLSRAGCATNWQWPLSWRVDREIAGLRIDIERLEGGATQKLDVRLGVRYGDTWIDPLATADAILFGPESILQRDLKSEEDFLRQFEQGGGTIVARRDEPKSAKLTISDFPGLVRRFRAQGITLRVAGQPVVERKSFKVHLHSGIDWFDLDGRVTFADGTELGLPDVLARAQSGGWVVLGDGSVGLLPEEWMRMQGLIAAGDAGENGQIKIPASRAMLLDAMLAERSLVEGDPGYRTWSSRMAAIRNPQGRDPREAFIGSLRPYQRVALGWLEELREARVGGCLADDMGLGKTVQLLAHLDRVHATPGREKLTSIVVCPRSLLFNWREEAARFTPSLKVAIWWGAERNALTEDLKAGTYDLVITTYRTLRLDIEIFAPITFEVAALDEAQAIKNPGSQVAKAARLLKARQRVALSGTPIENHLGELWSLSEYLNPGMLGRSSAFSRAFGERAEPHARVGLGQALRPLFLRRTKEEVATDLPPKTEQIIWCELEDEERQAYGRVAEFYRTALGTKIREQGLASLKIQVLEALLRLRQLACHRGLVDATQARASSAKLETLLHRLEEVIEGGHKALVFSQFTSFLALVKAELERRGIVHEYLDGSTTHRERRVKRFESDENCPVFLVSLKAGGTGLNLVAADYVFLLDPWWNPAVEAQAIDRAHRIGQTRPVHAYRLIAKGTVEEKVLALQQQKRDLAADLFGDDHAILRTLTLEDLELLLA